MSKAKKTGVVVFNDNCGTIEAWNEDPMDQCNDQEPLAYISVGCDIIETSISMPQEVSLSEAQEILDAAKIIKNYSKAKIETYKALLKVLNKETK